MVPLDVGSPGAHNLGPVGAPSAMRSCAASCCQLASPVPIIGALVQPRREVHKVLQHVRLGVVDLARIGFLVGPPRPTETEVGKYMCLEEAMLNLKRRVAKRRAAVAVKRCPCPFGCIPVIKGDGPAGVNQVAQNWRWRSQPPILVSYQWNL